MLEWAACGQYRLKISFWKFPFSNFKNEFSRRFFLSPVTLRFMHVTDYCMKPFAVRQRLRWNCQFGHAVGMDVSPSISASSCTEEAFDRTGNTPLPNPILKDLHN
jgi:hypothetical protein